MAALWPARHRQALHDWEWHPWYIFELDPDDVAAGAGRS
jgi:hypothetical protein